MDKIYVIIQGSYSDWEIKGFVTTEEEAKSFCDKWNESHGDLPCWDDYYYQEVSAVSFVGLKSKIRYKYDFVYGELGNYKRDYISVHEENVDGTIIDSFGDEIHTGIERCSPELWVTVVLDVLDKERAKKISRDMIAEYLYRRDVEGFDFEDGKIEFPKDEENKEGKNTDTFRQDIERAREYLKKRKRMAESKKVAEEYMGNMEKLISRMVEN